MHHATRMVRRGILEREPLIEGVNSNRLGETRKLPTPRMTLGSSRMSPIAEMFPQATTAQIVQCNVLHAGTQEAVMQERSHAHRTMTSLLAVANNQKLGHIRALQSCRNLVMRISPEIIPRTGKQKALQVFRVVPCMFPQAKSGISIVQRTTVEEQKFRPLILTDHITRVGEQAV